MGIKEINYFLQQKLIFLELPEVTAVQAAEWLDEANILKDSPNRPGLPLRNLLREGKIIGARQEENHRWFIESIKCRLENSVAEIIKNRFGSKDTADIPYINKNETFEAKYTDDGIIVNNLGSQPLLPWKVFAETINLLIRKNGKASKGDAMAGKLGEEKLPIDSVEGYIAYKIYGKQLGESVFRRITPIACILIWAGFVDNQPGYLVLSDSFKSLFDNTYNPDIFR